MIQDLTLEQISIAVIFIGGLIGGVKYLKNALEEFLTKLLEDQFNVVNDKLKELDTQACKNFLVRYLADVERGELIFDSEQQRFWEEYDHYIDDLHENSYVKEWVARLKKEGKLVRR